MAERGGVRVGFVVLAIVSLVLGIIGFAQLLAAEPGGTVHPLDVVYYSLQLFTLGAEPLQQGGPYPLAIEIARFTAPAVTIYALIEAGRLLFAAEVARFRARRAKGHVVVIGDSLLAAGLARRLKTQGHKVVSVSSKQVTWPSSAGVVQVRGDGRDPGVLRDAGVARAATIFACTDDSADNVTIALEAAQHRTEHSVYAHVADPAMCLAWQARHLGTGPGSPVRLDFFNVNDLAARSFWAADPLPAKGTRPPKLVVISASAFACAIIVEAARQWWVRDQANVARLQVRLIDAAASATARELVRRYPFLPSAVDLEPVDHDFASLVTAERARRELIELDADRIFVCHEDEQVALTTAVTHDCLWHGGPGSLVVRLDQLASLPKALAAARSRELFDEVTDALRLFGVVDAAADPDLIRDDLGERLARVMHESYLLARRRCAPGAYNADVPTSSLRALVTWDELADHYKHGNRSLAADIGPKLRLIGCVLAPRSGPGAEHVLTAAEVDRLAEAEHERWAAERTAAGWRHGTDYDSERKTNPLLQPWPQMAPEVIELNRLVIRELPQVLGTWGFRIVRIGTVVA